MTDGRSPTEQLPYGAASLSERRTAFCAALLLAALAAAALPFGSRLGGESVALLPAVSAAALVAMLVCAAILHNQYHLTRFAPLAFLGAAYGSTAILLIPYILSLPQVVAPNGFGAGDQTLPVLWAAWHVSFVVLSGAYVWSEIFFQRRALAGARDAENVQAYVLLTALCAILAGAGIVLFHADLPELVLRGVHTQAFRLFVELPLLAAIAAIVVTLALRTKFRHTNHLWLGVVLIALAVEIALSGEITRTPFSVSWYLGVGTAFVWQALFLVVQLVHGNYQLTAVVADRRSLEEETLRDVLTGLYNRRGFNLRYEAAMADCRLACAPLALLALDLDFFKPYNDHYGHIAGDDALRRVSKALQQVANRPEDSCCRVGGEEFAIVLPMTDISGATAVAERVRGTMMRMRIPHAYGGPQAILTVSIGVAVAEGGAPLAARELYERADKALYRAKRLGRNRFATYSDYSDSVSSPRRVG